MISLECGLQQRGLDQSVGCALDQPPKPASAQSLPALGTPLIVSKTISRKNLSHNKLTIYSRPHPRTKVAVTISLVTVPGPRRQKSDSTRHAFNHQSRNLSVMLWVMRNVRVWCPEPKEVFGWS